MATVKGSKSPTWEEKLDRQLGLDSQSSRGGSSVYAYPSNTNVSAISVGDDRTVTVDDLRRSLAKSLQSGMTIEDDILDDSGVLLLAAGSHITARFLQLLRNRKIRKVRLRAKTGEQPCSVEPELSPDGDPTPDVFSYHTPLTRDLDDRLAGDLQFRPECHPVRAWRRPRLGINDLKCEALAGVQKHAATSTAVADLCESINHGQEISSTDLRHTINRYVEMAAVDFDLLPLIVSLQHSGDEYLYDHCVNVSLISMAIASQQGLGHDAIATIGMGGLLHDIGMLRVPASIRLSPSGLSDREWDEIRLHPLHTLDMLAGIRGIPRLVKLIAYQAHERANGSGYPRRRTAKQVHEYAKIVAVADAYSAMTRTRPYRIAQSPYSAATTLLHAAAEHQFDCDLLRSFLDAISLFPIGSRITLSDGSLARVLRANPGLHTKPIVEAVAQDGTPLGHVLDLSAEGSPLVIQAG